MRILKVMSVVHGEAPSGKQCRQCLGCFLLKTSCEMMTAVVTCSLETWKFLWHPFYSSEKVSILKILIGQS
jgi:hypothetical protein